MLYDSYMDSERYGFVHPRAAAILFKPDVCIRTITHLGFFVATNVKIRQGVCMKRLAIIIFVLFGFTSSAQAGCINSKGEIDRGCRGLARPGGISVEDLVNVSIPDALQSYKSILPACTDTAPLIHWGRHLCFGTKTIGKASYTGEFFYGKPGGVGVMKEANGDIYNGEFLYEQDGPNNPKPPIQDGWGIKTFADSSLKPLVGSWYFGQYSGPDPSVDLRLDFQQYICHEGILDTRPSREKFVGLSKNRGCKLYLSALSVDILKPAFNNNDILYRKQVQHALAAFGYYNGNIDGLWGINTEKAVVQYILKKKVHPFIEAERAIHNIMTSIPLHSSFGFAILDESLSNSTTSSQSGASSSSNNTSSSSSNSSSSSSSRKSGGGNLLGLVIGGVLCSLAADNSGACMGSFVDGMNGSDKAKNRRSNQGTATSSNSSAKSCSSDYSCGIGKLCVKKPYASSGICMTSVNEYGIKTYPNKSTDSIYMGTTNKSCQYITDCPVSFTCDRTYNVCVKN